MIDNTINLINKSEFYYLSYKYNIYITTGQIFDYHNQINNIKILTVSPSY